MTTIKVKKLSPDAKAPFKAKPTAIGWDLYALKNTTIPSSGGMKWVETGIALELPKGYWAKIEGRSGYSLDHKIDVGAGIIDNDYTGPIKVLIYNFSAYPTIINKGDRFAQIVLHKEVHAEIEEVEELAETARAADGFGSTGNR